MNECETLPIAVTFTDQAEDQRAGMIPVGGADMTTNHEPAKTSDETAAGQWQRIDEAHGGPNGTVGQGEAGLTDEGSAPLDPIAAGMAMLEVVNEPTPEMLDAVSGQSPDSEREQLQIQVAQLAGHLRERLKDLDRREAQHNACVAQLEKDVRASRLWLQERELGFQEREAALQRRVEELEEVVAAKTQAAQIATAELEDQQRRMRDLVVAATEREEALRVQIESLERDADGDLANYREFGSSEVEEFARASEGLDEAAGLGVREQELLARLDEVQLQAAAREQQLLSRVDELERQLTDTHRALQAATWDADARRQELIEREERIRSLEQAKTAEERELLEQLEQRQNQVSLGEEMLVKHAQELDAERAELLAEREAWSERVARERQEFADERQAAKAAEEQRHERAAQRQAYLERQRASLEQVRTEILALHKESLEMRLLAEQVWSQVTGRLTPAEVTHAIAQLKLQLAEQYRCEEDQLQAARDELTQLSERVAEQHRELTQLRSGLREWAAARQADLEAQAAALVKREQALEQEEQELLARQRQWRAERAEMQERTRGVARAA